MDKSAQSMKQKANQNKPIFNEDGAVGKQFKADGNIGSIGQKIGGPFSKDGSIGKNFNPDGAIGGAVNETAGKDNSM